MAINAALVGEVVAQSALEAFSNYLTPLNAFSTDFGGEIGARGQVVNVPIFNGYTAGTFGGNYTTGASNDVGAAVVTIDRHRYKTISLTDLEVANNGSGATNTERFGRQLGYALATAVFGDVLSVVTAANFGTATAFTGTHTGFDSDDVVDIKAVCDADKMPQEMRSLILSGNYYNALLKDTSVKEAQAYGGTEAIRQGRIANLVGFENVWQSNSIPSNSESLVGFAAYPSAIAIAMRYLAPQEDHTYGIATSLQDPDTGAVLGWRQWYDNATGTRYLTLEANFGYALGQAAALKRITSA